MEKGFVKAQIIKRDATTQEFTAVASSALVDRHGEIVSVEGWDLENFKANPVLLWSHDHTIPAIGKATKIWVDGVGDKAKLMFTGIWQTVTQEGRDAAELVAQGIINSFSVGFLPREMVGNKYTDQELLEISLVNVPANPQAVMLAYKNLKEKGLSDAVSKAVIQGFTSKTVVAKDMFKTERGAVQDELDAEAILEAKYQNVDKVWDIMFAFMDVYFSDETPVDDFGALLNETAELLKGLSPVAEDSEDEKEVVDNNLESNNDKDNTAKVPEPTAPNEPDAKKIRARQTLTKAITKASDQLLVGEKNGISKSERVKLTKVIKRAGEILSKSNKGDLRNG